MASEQPPSLAHVEKAAAQPDDASQKEDGEASESGHSSADENRPSSGDRMKTVQVESAPSDPPPLPYDEAPPEDDGWDYLWDNNANAYYFYNRYTGTSQWENPRLPQAAAATHDSYDRYASSSAAPGTSPAPKRRYGGYNPAIHGNYDPNADYAKEAEREEEEMEAAAAAPVVPGLPGSNVVDYSTTAHFNRFTGKFQQPGLNPEYHNDENKSKRQMNAFFDVDAAANSHDGRSLKAERRSKALSKKELKAFQNKRRDRKEEKRRAWLTRD